MVVSQPNVDPMGHYSIKATAELLGVHRNTITRYCKQRLMRMGRNHKGRHNHFITGEEILRIWRGRA